MQKSLRKYDSITAAKYMLALAYEKGIVLNVTKVQKMLFIAYGFFLSRYNHVLLTETPKAWPYGPVFPKTRSRIDFGKMIRIDDPELGQIVQDPVVTEVFHKIIDKYSRYSAGQLSDWSHTAGSPWEKTTKLTGFDWNQTIPDPYIKDYFATVNV